MHLKSQGISFRLVMCNNADAIIQLDQLLYIDMLN